jgi:hypothetical protein
MDDLEQDDLTSRPRKVKSLSLCNEAAWQTDNQTGIPQERASRANLRKSKTNPEVPMGQTREHPALANAYRQPSETL